MIELGWCRGEGVFVWQGVGDDAKPSFRAGRASLPRLPDEDCVRGCRFYSGDGEEVRLTPCGSG